MDCAAYTDDIQLCFHVRQDDILVAKTVLEQCICQMHICLASNRLPLNLDKTEVMCCSSARQMGTFEQPVLSIGQSTIQPSCAIRNLVVQPWVDISITDQINPVIHSCYYNIRQLCMVCLSLTLTTLWVATYVLVLTCINYCHVLMWMLPHMKYVTEDAYQYCSVCRVHMFTIWYISNFIRDNLQWLPISQRIHFNPLDVVGR